MAARLRWVLVFVFVGVHLLAFPAQSHACQGCLEWATPEESFEKAQVVFAGRVVQQEPITSTRPWWDIFDHIYVKADTRGLLQSNQVEVSTIWKGPSVANYTVEDTACGIHFELNQEYVIYGYRDGGVVRVRQCGSTTSIEHAQDSLIFLGEGRPPPIVMLRASRSNPASINFPFLISESLVGLFPVILWSRVWLNIWEFVGWFSFVSLPMFAILVWRGWRKIWR